MCMTFLGAAGTVTGSKYLLEHRHLHLLFGCSVQKNTEPERPLYTQG
jgi:hypothetical protein